MSNYYFPTELWLEIKSYLLLDEPTYYLLTKLSKYSINKLLQNFKFETKQLKFIKDATINILSRKKYILKLLLSRCNKNEIQNKIQLIEKHDSEKYEWLQDFRVGEEILCYDMILFEGRKKYLKRKGVIVKIGLKSVSIKFYNYEIKPKNNQGHYPVEWKQEFEKKTKIVFDNISIIKNEPYYAGQFLVGRFYNF
jgi:hypothetical protein